MYAKLRLPNILKLSCRPIDFTSYKAFLKHKKRPETSLPASFSAWFLKKNTFLVMFHYLTKIHCLVAFTSFYIGEHVHCNCLLARLWRQTFWKQPYLSNEAVFSAWTKCQDKNLNNLRTKIAIKVQQKAFLIIFKGLSLNQTEQIFLEGEYPTLN